LLFPPFLLVLARGGEIIMDISTEGNLHFIRGVCIEVLIEEYISSGDTLEEVLAVFPGLTVPELKYAINYAEKHLPASYDPWKKEIREFKVQLAFYGQKGKAWPGFPVSQDNED
jgi:uncharacterized protein (DUF433 family)